MNPAIIIIVAFPIVFIGMWLFVTFILSKIGWAKLLTHYEHASSNFDGDEIGTAGGRINGVNYNGILELKANHHGLHIVPIKIFSYFHPPVMIPWGDIRKGNEINLMFTKYTPLFVFRNGKKVAGFRLSEKQMTRLESYLKS